MNPENEVNSKKKAHLVIKGKIKSAVDKSNDKVFAKVIKDIAEPIIEKRSALIEKGLDKIDSLEKELEKMKPDQVHYPVDKDTQKPLQVSLPAVYSESLFKKRTEMEQKLNKLHEAFEKIIPLKEGIIPDYDSLEKELAKK